MEPLDIAVAGCGPGGLAAALLLKRDGHRVTMFERFDAPQPIGSGLMIQPTGLAVLDQLDLADLTLRSGARIDRLIGQVDMAGPVVLDVHYSALRSISAFGIGIHRTSLFALLHDAVTAAGVPIATGRTVTGSVLDGAKRHLRFSSGETAGPYDLVVDALGTRTTLAPLTGRKLAFGALWASLDWPREANFDTAALEQRYRWANTMVGIMPIGQPSGAACAQGAFFWSLRADRLDAWRAAGLDAWKADVLALWPACAPLLEQIVDPEQLTFAHYSHRTLRDPAKPALVHIGDAWHSASPQLGQGANMALLDAWALATSLRECASVADGVTLAVARRRRHVHLYQWLTALFTPVYQSDSRVLPFVRDRLVGPISKLWPATWIQAAMVSGLIGNPLRPLGLEVRASPPQNMAIGDVA